MEFILELPTVIYIITHPKEFTEQLLCVYFYKASVLGSSQYTEDMGYICETSINII